MDFLKNNKKIALYMIILALTALALGLSDAIFSNYFKEVYDISAFQRGLIEFPRELPGVLCIVLISSLSFLGDLRMAMIAQVLSIIGILILGVITPPFAVMLIFLFINSLGMHLFFPLQDGIGMALIGEEKIGKRMGQFKGISTAFTMIASIMVFAGFRSEFFSFTTATKLPFLISGICLVIVLILFILLQQLIHNPIKKDRKVKWIFRKKYQYYYILAIMNGVQKQIMIVYGPWVLIDLLGKRADTLAIISIVGSFIGIFFIPALGRWIDRFGIKKMLYLDALSFIVVYLLYGMLSGGFATGYLPTIGLPVALTLGLLIIDKMSMQMGIIRTVYLRSIAIAPEDITPTLSLGISMDHIVSIVCASIGGVLWSVWGPQYIFFFAAALSLVNLFVAIKVQPEKSVASCTTNKSPLQM
ncbi:MAG: MFS transporter [Cellulosilyticaceae bacterium]